MNHWPSSNVTSRKFWIRCADSIPIYYLGHWLQTHDGYFPNSFRPISYLGYIWVRSEKQSLLWKTTGLIRLIKPNYFKKQRSSSSFFLTWSRYTGPKWPWSLSRLVLCVKWVKLGCQVLLSHFGPVLGSANKNLRLFAKSPGDFKMETMDF